MTEYEQDIVSIISSSGESKAKAFEALKYAKLGDFNKARVLLIESREIDLSAHRLQTELIQKEFDETSTKTPITLLMVHAQDHYMTSQLARDLIEYLIDIFETQEKGSKS